MGMSMNRREFLRAGGGAAAGVFLGGRLSFAQQVELSTPNAEKLGWRMGVQLYTYRRFSFYEALDKIAALGVRHVEPGFFLKLDKERPKLTTSEKLDADARKELKDKLADRGMSLSSFYAALGSVESGARKIFEFCKEMGAGVIAAEPPPKALEMIDKLCEEYGINVGIHNHPESKNYKNWNPDYVLESCKGRSRRIGGCCDTGHWVRSGLNPVECLKKMEGRIIEVHLKDAAEMGNRKAEDTILGAGKADFKAVLQELKRQGFKGLTVIEYEKDTGALQEDMVKNVAYVEAMAKELGG